MLPSSAFIGRVFVGAVNVVEMKNDSSSTMTISYDKKTQESYNVLEDRPYRTAQPKVFTPALGHYLHVLILETSDISSS